MILLVAGLAHHRLCWLPLDLIGHFYQGKLTQLTVSYELRVFKGAIRTLVLAALFRNKRFFFLLRTVRTRVDVLPDLQLAVLASPGAVIAHHEYLLFIV